MSETENQQLPIPNTILKQQKILQQDILQEKYNFDKLGQNGIFEVDPKVVKFQGYEKGKLNILKVKVINCSKYPQRLHILPPNSKVFTIKFSKKGQLASGMYEEIIINFIPTQYQPIHAFPVLNKDNPQNIFPRMIDFGSLEIGKTQVYKFPLQCKIPLNFEYEFTFLKENMDIKIEPIKGIIPGKGTVQVEIIFSPQKNTTVFAEAELKISQFDFKPLIVKIMGNGIYKDNKAQGIGSLKQRPSSVKKLLPLSKKQDTLEFFGTDKVSATMGQGLMKKSFQSQSQNEISEEQQQPTSAQQQQQQGEQQFLKILEEQQQPTSAQQQEQLVEQQFSKGQPYQLKPLITTGKQQLKQQQSQTDMLKESVKSSEKGDVSEKQQQFQKSSKQQLLQQTDLDFQQKSMMSQTQQQQQTSLTPRQIMEKMFLDKFNIVQQLDKDKEIKFFSCIGDKEITDQEIDVIEQEKQHYKQNQDDQLEFNGAHRYQQETNQDLAIIEQVLPEHTNEWDIYKSDPQTRRNWIKFEFDMDQTFVNQKLFATQYESSSQINHEGFKVIPVDQFDDNAEVEPLQVNDKLVMNYKWTPIDFGMVHNTIESERILRTGCEEENFLRGKSGPFEEQKQQEQVIQAVPQPCSKPFDYVSHKWVFPHNSVRAFVQPILVTEIEPEFKLTARQILFQDYLDPTLPTAANNNNNSYGGSMDPNIGINVLKYEFLSKTPGLYSIQTINKLAIELQFYYTKRFNLPADYAFENNIEKYSPKIMDQPAVKEDYFTDSDSEAEDPPVVETEELDTFLNKIEADDKTIKTYREQFESQIKNDIDLTYNTINENLSKNKFLQVSLIPSKTSNYNKFIEDPENKLFLI